MLAGKCWQGEGDVVRIKLLEELEARFHAGDAAETIDALEQAAYSVTPADPPSAPLVGQAGCTGHCSKALAEPIPSEWTEWQLKGARWTIAR